MRRHIPNVRFSSDEFETFVCIASGPSLRQEDVDLVQAWRNKRVFDEQGFLQKRRVIAVKSSFKIAPWADYVYGYDYVWWKQYIDELSKLSGELWTCNKLAGEHFDVNYVECSGRDTLETDGRIGWGKNSGYQAINLAFNKGASRVILLGFDSRKKNGQLHWHDPHPYQESTDMPTQSWSVKFNGLAEGLKREGIHCINSSRETALTCFERMDLEQALAL